MRDEGDVREEGTRNHRASCAMVKKNQRRRGLVPRIPELSSGPPRRRPSAKLRGPGAGPLRKRRGRSAAPRAPLRVPGANRRAGGRPGSGPGPPGRGPGSCGPGRAAVVVGGLWVWGVARPGPVAGAPGRLAALRSLFARSRLRSARVPGSLLAAGLGRPLGPPVAGAAPSGSSLPCGARGLRTPRPALYMRAARFARALFVCGLGRFGSLIRSPPASPPALSPFVGLPCIHS